MKTFKRSQIIVTTICIMLGVNTALAAGPGFGNHSGSSACLTGAIVSQLPYEELSQQEQDGLLKMREEEKLARDVYMYLNDLWQDAVFSNISQSEQRHMDAVAALISKYNLQDPVANMGPGQFNSAEMQDLYNSLTQKGTASLEEALMVGATIEDLDIKDLEELLAATDNQDIQTVYQNLVKGSRNHLRAFTARLAAMGDTYTAQFLTQDQVDTIINSPWERGRVDKDGNTVAGPGRSGGGHGAMGRGNRANFIDMNGDGICDNRQ